MSVINLRHLSSFVVYGHANIETILHLRPSSSSGLDGLSDLRGT